MKRLSYFLFILSPLLLIGCLKPLVDEGVENSVVLYGQVFENGNGTPVAGMQVLVTDGERRGEQCQTAADGSFSLSVSYSQLMSHYFMRLTADSLYQSLDVYFPSIIYGTDECQLPDIYVNGPELPQVTIDSLTSITKNSVICFGRIVDDGRSYIRERGICWGSAHNPTVANDTVRCGNGSGGFGTIITGLTKGTGYYVRAYARNGVDGIAYSHERFFMTMTGAPTLGAITIPNYTENSITCRSEVVSDNGSSVTDRGFCYSTISNPPTINDIPLAREGSGMGVFTYTIHNLQPHTTYYIRAYAINSEGVEYSSETKIVTTL